MSARALSPEGGTGAGGSKMAHDVAVGGRPQLPDQESCLSEASRHHMSFCQSERPRRTRHTPSVTIPDSHARPLLSLCGVHGPTPLQCTKGPHKGMTI